MQFLLWITIHAPGADPAFLIRGGGPNLEIFLSDLKKLSRRD